MPVRSDIEIARAAKMKPIDEIGERLGIPSTALLHYGPHKAKLAFSFIESLAPRPDGHLVLVTAITPTPAGEGKTTTTVGLGDGLNRIGKRRSPKTELIQSPLLGLVMQLLINIIRLPLPFHIIINDVFIAMFSYSAHKITVTPKFASPKLRFHGRNPFKNVSCGQALNDLYHLFRTIGGYRLD